MLTFMLMMLILMCIFISIWICLYKNIQNILSIKFIIAIFIFLCQHYILIQFLLLLWCLCFCFCRCLMLMLLLLLLLLLAYWDSGCVYFFDTLEDVLVIPGRLVIWGVVFKFSLAYFIILCFSIFVHLFCAFFNS